MNLNIGMPMSEDETQLQTAQVDNLTCTEIRHPERYPKNTGPHIGNSEQQGLLTTQEQLSKPIWNAT
jgi:hypothetical protein